MAAKQTNTVEAEAMSLITDNIEKLKVLLSGSKGEKPLKYKFKGKRSTKTVFMSVKLQYLLNDFCIENEIKIGEVIENAVVEFLTRSGWEEKLQEILDTSQSTGEKGENE